ncbi:hypothetical protein N7467_012306 [Penicillium canescens]|nr:hypothetical protein N7467_012306 [Penicillium canescens]
MAVSAQRNIPAILVTEGLVTTIGSAFGGTVAVAMWTGIFPVKLLALLPTSTPADFASIYGSLFVQQFYAREQQPVMLSTMYMVTHNVSCSLLQPAFTLSHEHLVSSGRVLNVKKMKQQVHGIHP